MTAWIDLTQFIPNLGLVNRLPAGLLTYYQALPLAVDGDQVSVAMVYPGNLTAIAVLSDLLGAQIVPVQTSAEAMQALLSKIFPTTNQATAQVLLWAGQGEATPGVARMTAALASFEHASLVELTATAVTPRDVLVAAAEGNFRLAVLAFRKPAPLPDLVLHASAPFLAVQPNTALRRILVVLRGFAADLKLVQWAVALALAEPAHLTLLPMTADDVFSLGELLNPATAQGRHLTRCTRLADAVADRTTLRLHTGAAERQILAELAAQPYDMLALPAEGHGAFVAAVLRTAAANAPAALLVTKSTSRLATSRPHPQTKRRL